MPKLGDTKSVAPRSTSAAVGTTSGCGGCGRWRGRIGSGARAGNTMGGWASRLVVTAMSFATLAAFAAVADVGSERPGSDSGLEPSSGFGEQLTPVTLLER